MPSIRMAFGIAYRASDADNETPNHHFAISALLEMVLSRMARRPSRRPIVMKMVMLVCAD